MQSSQPRNRLALLEPDQCRQTDDFEPLRRLRTLVDVDSSKSQLCAAFAKQRLQNAHLSSAGGTPRSFETDNNWPRSPLNGQVEIDVIQVRYRGGI